MCDAADVMPTGAEQAGVGTRKKAAKANANEPKAPKACTQGPLHHVVRRGFVAIPLNAIRILFNML